MTPQQLKAMKLALEALKTSMYPQQKQLQAITALEEALAEHAMREVQRLGQEIEQEPLAHWSDCAVHSEPAYPKSECDCGGIVAVADYTALSDKYVALSDKYVALKAQHKEQEPVAWQGVHDQTDLYYRKPPQADARPLYTTPSAPPPQRTWVGLTDDEIEALASWWPSYDQMPAIKVLIKDVTNSLKEKNQ